MTVVEEQAFLSGKVYIKATDDHVQEGGLRVSIVIEKPGWKPQEFSIVFLAHNDDGRTSKGMNELSVMLPRIFDAIWDNEENGRRDFRAGVVSLELEKEMKDKHRGQLKAILDEMEG